MTSDERKIDIFIENVYGKKITRISEMIRLGLDESVIIAIKSFVKKMVVLYLGLHYMNSEAFCFHFHKLIPLRRRVFNVITTQCFKFCDSSPSPFLSLLYSACFVYSTLDSCELKNLSQYENFGPLCLKTVFDHRIKEDFYSQGGWDKLIEFSLAENLSTIIDHLGHIFAETYTIYRIGDSTKKHAGFGYCTMDVVKVSLVRLDQFKDFIKNAFLLQDNEKGNVEKSLKNLKKVLEKRLEVYHAIKA